MRPLSSVSRPHAPPLALRRPAPTQRAPPRVPRPPAAAAVAADHSAAATDSSRGAALMDWLNSSGAPQPAVTLASVTREGRPLDILVAARDLAPGDRALAVPERLVITLAQVFEDNDLADLLSGAKKVSVLAQLALFLMYEKKARDRSCWKPLLDELDRIQGRGPAGAKSPLLWDEGQAETLLAGSPVLAELAERKAAMRAEWKEADDVWFLASAFFSRYPFDAPSQVFTEANFISAYCAVQAAVVHLMGVPPALRFALVPLGPPLLQYSATSKAVLRWDDAARAVVLDVDAPVRAGDPVLAWCGPQPNRRLLLNYGTIFDDNPADALPLRVTCPPAAAGGDPLAAPRRAALAAAGASSDAEFKLTRGGGLPAGLLPALRLALCDDAAVLSSAGAAAAAAAAGPLSPANEAAALTALHARLAARRAGYRSTVAEDEAVIASPDAGPRPKVAARLLRLEKLILDDALAAVKAAAAAAGVACEGAAAPVAVRVE